MQRGELCLGWPAGFAQVAADVPGAWLVSRFDGFTGWLVAGLTALMILVALIATRGRRPGRERGL